MIAFLRSWKFAAAGVALAIAAAGGAYVKGRIDGKAIGRADQLQDTFEKLKQRNENNETVRHSGDADRCKLIGGVLAQGRCE